MKVVIQKTTAIDEVTVIELDSLDQLPEAQKALDARLMQTNQKIVEVRDFIAQVKDPNYRYLFVAFLDGFLGISSNAESLARKYKVEPPAGFDQWLLAKETKDQGNKPITVLPGGKKS